MRRAERGTAATHDPDGHGERGQERQPGAGMHQRIEPGRLKESERRQDAAASNASGSRRVAGAGVPLRVSTGTKCSMAPKISGRMPAAKATCAAAAGLATPVRISASAVAKATTAATTRIGSMDRVMDSRVRGNDVAQACFLTKSMTMAPGSRCTYLISTFSP